MSGLGINVVRTWGFCNGCGANSIQTAVILLPASHAAVAVVEA